MTRQGGKFKRSESGSPRAADVAAVGSSTRSPKLVRLPQKSGYTPPAKPQRGEFSDVRVAILAPRWNVEIVDALIDGARRGLRAWGVAEANAELVRVPGAFELPLAAALAARRKPGYDGIVAVGVVIRGQTPHFDFVAGECARGLREVSVRRRLPLGFGVLTVDDAEQARRRAGPRRDNKGYEAAVAVLEMLRLSWSMSA